MLYRYITIALLAAACGVGGTVAVYHIQQENCTAAVVLPKSEPEEGEQPAPDITLADMLSAMASAEACEWEYAGHHAVSQLANAPFFTENEADMCIEQEIRDASRLAAMLFVSNYEELELAWWQSRSPLRRLIILSLFYTQMDTGLCCFPNFTCSSFAPEIAEQRRREKEWVVAHRAELEPVLSRLVHEIRQKRTESK